MEDSPVAPVVSLRRLHRPTCDVRVLRQIYRETRALGGGGGGRRSWVAGVGMAVQGTERERDKRARADRTNVGDSRGEPPANKRTGGVILALGFGPQGGVLFSGVAPFFGISGPRYAHHPPGYRARGTPVRWRWGRKCSTSQGVEICTLIDEEQLFHPTATQSTPHTLQCSRYPHSSRCSPIFMTCFAKKSSMVYSNPPGSFFGYDGRDRVERSSGEQQ